MSCDDTGGWPAVMGFARLSPDARHLAAHIQATGELVTAIDEAIGELQAAEARAAEAARKAETAQAALPRNPGRHVASQPDPVAQWWRVTRSLVPADYGQLVRRVPDRPPGTCTHCHTGPLFLGGECWYCSVLGDLRAATRPVRTTGGRAAVARAALAGCGIVLALLAVHVLAALIIPAAACFWLALSEREQR